MAEIVSVVSATVKGEGNLLVVEPRGMVSKLAALRARLEIPLSCVRQVSTDRAEPRELKMAGTAFPPRTIQAFFMTLDRAGYSTHYLTGTGA